MTKEEAKEVLYRTEQFGVYDQTHEAVETVFKALEQSVSLDRIKKARGEMYEASHADADGCNTVIDLEDALDIIDKLIAEVEEN